MIHGLPSLGALLRQLAFVANGEKGLQLWLRPLDQVTAQPLAGTDHRPKLDGWTEEVKKS